MQARDGINDNVEWSMSIVTEGELVSELWDERPKKKYSRNVAQPHPRILARKLLRARDVRSPLHFRKFFRQPAT